MGLMTEFKYDNKNVTDVMLNEEKKLSPNLEKKSMIFLPVIISLRIPSLVSAIRLKARNNPMINVGAQQSTNKTTTATNILITLNETTCQFD